MSGRIFNAAQLMVINNVARHTDHKKLTQTRRKNRLRNHSGIRTSHNNRMGMLTVLISKLAQGR